VHFGVRRGENAKKLSTGRSLGGLKGGSGRRCMCDILGKGLELWENEIEAYRERGEYLGWLHKKNDPQKFEP